MSTFLIILLILVAVLVIIFLRAARLSDTYTISREIEIDRPVADVFGFVRLIRNQEKYNKWVMLDPNSRKETKGEDGTVGFILAWDSANKQVGKGEQEIRNIVDGKQIDLAIRFEKPFKGESTAQMNTAPVGGSKTRLNWVFAGERKGMMKVIHMLMNLEKVLGNDLDTSLRNLKGVLEKA